MYDLAERSLPNLDKLKATKSILDVLDELGVEVLSDNKIFCLWHEDNTPNNCHIYEDSNRYHCFACGSSGSIIDLVMKVKSFNVIQAGWWIEDNITHDRLHKTDNKIINVPDKPQFPHTWITSWRKELENGKRSYLYNRMLTDQSINSYWLGWRPDYSAYVIPYWQGLPGKSKVDVVQYRSTKNSFGDWKYIGHEGYYHPSILNRHFINKHFVVVFIGTFDALLAAQDGIPAISINGASVFTNSKSPHTHKLWSLLQTTKRVYIVPDNTVTEYEPAENLAETIGSHAKVRYFPFSLTFGKDYTDFRQSGYAPDKFVWEVLRMDSSIFVSDTCRHYYKQIVNFLESGELQKVYTTTQNLIFCVQQANPDMKNSIILNAFKRDLDLTVILRSAWKTTLDIFTDEEWSAISLEMEKCNSFECIYDLFNKWGTKALIFREKRLGGF